MTMIKSTQEAIAILQNTRLSELAREDAIYYLQEYPSPEGMEALVAALQDDDPGVQWAAGAALAQLGDAGIPALLRALSQPSEDTLLRQGARHVLHYNASTRVRQQTQELMQALKGPGSSVSTMEVAYKLLAQWK
jgi:HEAT repeat protein